MSEIDEIYNSRLPALQAATTKLEALLKAVAAGIEDKKLVRTEIRCIRIKELFSIELKIAEHDWSASTALENFSDLVGGRVVCNNISDVYRFTELLKEQLQSGWEWFEIQDYIKDPQETGYRGIHINLKVNIGEHPFSPDLVPCEVQIRTRLQDAWAELSHGDIYKRPDLPEDLRARASDLAEILASSDKIAQDIRLRVTREIVSPEMQPDLSRVSFDSVSFIFKEVFGRPPSDYAVREAGQLSQKIEAHHFRAFATNFKSR